MAKTKTKAKYKWWKHERELKTWRLYRLVTRYYEFEKLLITYGRKKEYYIECNQIDSSFTRCKDFYYIRQSKVWDDISAAIDNMTQDNKHHNNRLIYHCINAESGINDEWSTWAVIIKNKPIKLAYSWTQNRFAQSKDCDKILKLHDGLKIFNTIKEAANITEAIPGVTQPKLAILQF